MKKLRQQVTKIPFLHHFAWRCVNLGNVLFYEKWKRENSVVEFWDLQKQKRSQDECFIIGNGPSLVPDDIKKIANKACFVSNGFYRIQELVDIRPLYYVIQDRYSVSNEIVNSLNAENILLSDYFWRTHCVNNVRAFCFPTVRVIGNEKIRFGSCDTKIVDAYTVTFSMIQIAIFLGYKKIYLLGIDHNYPFTYDEKGHVVRDDSVKSHFYGGERIDDFICNVEGMNKSYICARDEAQARGIEIVNVTRGGKLEVFRRKQLEDVL